MRIWSCFLWIYVLWVCGGCGLNKEGCSDPVASNYDPEADELCCCTYYNLRLNLRHFWGDTSTAFQLGTDYIGGNDTVFQVLQINLLVSGMRLLDASNQPHTSEDALTVVFTNGTSTQITDSYGLISPTAFAVEMGKFTRFGSYNAVRFTSGVSPAQQDIQPSFISEDRHPLSATAQPVLYDYTRSRYLAGQARVVIGANRDTMLIGWTDTTEIELPAAITARDGQNTDARVDILYQKLFQRILWGIDDSLTISGLLRENTRHIWQIRP